MREKKGEETLFNMVMFNKVKMKSFFFVVVAHTWWWLYTDRWSISPDLSQYISLDVDNRNKPDSELESYTNININIRHSTQHFFLGLLSTWVVSWISLSLSQWLLFVNSSLFVFIDGSKTWHWLRMQLVLHCSPLLVLFIFYFSDKKMTKTTGQCLNSMVHGPEWVRKI